jgi:hypothetical protein
MTIEEAERKSVEIRAVYDRFRAALPVPPAVLTEFEMLVIRLKLEGRG